MGTAGARGAEDCSLAHNDRGVGWPIAGEARGLFLIICRAGAVKRMGSVLLFPE